MKAITKSDFAKDFITRSWPTFNAPPRLLQIQTGDWMSLDGFEMLFREEGGFFIF